MRPRRATAVLLALLLANAASILFFRFFITIDGPGHVLYASLSTPWAAPDHLAHGITYNTNAVHGLLGDRILMVLLLFLTPEHAHDVLAAMASCAVVLAVVAFLRAHGTRMGLAILWFAPLAFNLLLFMGLFHFLLGVAVAFGTVAWWKWRAASPLTRWVGLLIGIAIASSTHRSSPALIGMLLLPAFVIELVKGRTIAGSGPWNLRWGIAIMMMLVAVLVFQLRGFLQGIQLPIPASLPVFNMDLLLRPLLLPGLAQGPWPVWCIGILLLIAVGAGVWLRCRVGRELFAHDGLLVLFLFFTLIAWLGNTPLGSQLLIAERSQWLALIVLAAWLVAIAAAHRGRLAHVIGGAALCALPLQLIRLVQAEEPLARLQEAHSSAMEACEHLTPRSLVMPVMAEPNWLLQQLWAYVAIKHNGIVLPPNDRVVFVGPPGGTHDNRWLRMTKDPHWLMRHWREGLPPEVDHVMFMGHGIERAVGQYPWRAVLTENYPRGFDNGYTRIYVRESMREAAAH